MPNLEFLVPQAVRFAQGRRGPHDSRLAAYVYCDMPCSRMGVEWFDMLGEVVRGVSKRRVGGG
jgi:hypothetical protein